MNLRREIVMRLAARKLVKLIRTQKEREFRLRSAAAKRGWDNRRAKA